MDLTTRFLTASWKALDDHILHGGPFPNDEVIVRIDPTLAVLMRDAHDEPRWIPASERLPGVESSPHGSVECIVACSTGLVTAMRYTENRGAKTEKGRRPRWEWNWRVATWHVTHWMPLPAPPEAP